MPQSETKPVAWIDVDNPPQVQYLTPFVHHLADERGYDVFLTARDYGATAGLIRDRGLEPVVLGHAAGAGKIGKIGQTLGRAFALMRLLRGRPKPRFLITASRSSAFAARMMGIPVYIFVDYEFVETGIFRRLGCAMLFPGVIGKETFRKLGFGERKMIPFAGLKEDISFAYVDTDAIAPLDLDAPEGVARVLLRPPATSSHYYRRESGELYRATLAHLASRDDVVVVFSPRYPEQAEDLNEFEWTHSPIILDNRANFVALLKAVDAVVSSGGTMLREAVYLGVHAFSIFRGPEGSVDRHLEQQGQLTFVRRAEDLERCDLARRRGEPRAREPRVVERIIDAVETRIAAG